MTTKIKDSFQVHYMALRKIENYMVFQETQTLQVSIIMKKCLRKMDGQFQRHMMNC